MLEKVLAIIAAIGLFLFMVGLLICLFIDLPEWLMTAFGVMMIPYLVYSKLTGGL